MSETRKFTVGVAFHVEIDSDSWALAHGLDASDRDAVGRDMVEWLRHNATQALALPSYVKGTVGANITEEPSEVTHRMSPEEAASNAGCWVEGARGWTAPGVLINKAADWGMPLDDDDRALVDHYLGGTGTEVTLPNGNVVDPDDVGEFVAGRGELADKAEEWLNENVAPDGWAFGWNEGEFYLWPVSQWEDVNV